MQPQQLSKAAIDRVLSVAAEQSAECDVLTTQASQAPQRMAMVQRLEAAQAQYDAAVAAFTDLALIASRGNALVALQLESAQLPLSEEDYLTLPARHAQLVPQVLQTCRELMKAKEVENLAGLTDKLTALGAVAVPALTGIYSTVFCPGCKPDFIVLPPARGEPGARSSPV
jgi:Tfp pilus assembly protein PilN